MSSEYKNGYQDGLAWARAMSELVTGAARFEAQNLPLDSPRQRELVGAIAMGQEVSRQIDEHVAEFLLGKPSPDSGGEGTVH
jgi:hypothetical protein